MRGLGLLSLITSGMLAWSVPLHAQKSAVPVIGFLSTASPASRGGDQVGAFHGGLRQEGYTEGGNVRIEYRWANDDYGRLRPLAEELVALRVAVIVAAGGNVSALVALDVTKEIPICFTTVTDPVKSGLVKSLNRPGGNATGTAGLTSELDPKRLELLHEMKPTAAVIGVLINPNRPGLETQLPELRAAADKMRLNSSSRRPLAIETSTSKSPSKVSPRSAWTHCSLLLIRCSTTAAHRCLPSPQGTRFLRSTNGVSS
jgi:putative tryptophan/tyrosine transport system substrate-binding protein